MKTQIQKTITILLLSSLMIFFYNKIAFSKYDDNEIKKNCYKAYLMSSKSLWEDLIKKLENRHKSFPDDIQLLFELTKVQYGLLYTCLANKDKETYNAYVDITKENISKLLEYNEEWSEVHAVMAGIYSIKMGFNPMQGMFLGPKSESHIEKAIKYDENNPVAWVRKAGSKFFTPEMFGGSITEAIKFYEKAVKLFEKDEKNTIMNWEYLDALVWLGISYQKVNNKEKAIATFKKALSIEPNFNWVKYRLLPEAEK